MVMEPENVQESKDEKLEREAKHLVHHVLAHSYTVYFFVLLVGVALDMLFPIRVFPQYLNTVGIVMLLLSSALIVWAQTSSIGSQHHRNNKEDLTHDHFRCGPYRYSRTPTHWGLFLLVLGFGLIINAFFITILTIVSFFITKVTLIAKEEKILESRYGEPYKEYKKSVKL